MSEMSGNNGESDKNGIDDKNYSDENMNNGWLNNVPNLDSNQMNDIDGLNDLNDLNGNRMTSVEQETLLSRLLEKGNIVTSSSKNGSGSSGSSNSNNGGNLGKGGTLVIQVKKSEGGATATIASTLQDDKDDKDSGGTTTTKIVIEMDRDAENFSDRSKATEDSMTPLMKATRSRCGEDVKKEIHAIKRRFGKHLGGMCEALDQAEKDAEQGEIYKPSVTLAVQDCDQSAELVGDEARATIKISKDGGGGWAAVHYACEWGNHEGLRYLLDAGADPNLTERMGATPLHRAILAAGRCRVGSNIGSNGSSFGSNISTNGSGIVSNIGSNIGSSNIAAELEDYIKCAKLLLDHERFDLMKNERREDEYNVAGRPFQKPPKNDGYGISPACLCVCQAYSSRDALYPILELLLTRGFDPNGTMCGVSALQIALRNAHYGCAFALARAGANVNTVHPEDGKSGLQAADLIFGESFARELREASVVALAVADPTRRRDLLRSQGTEGAKKLAKRAMNAGHSFIKASRWREAAGAYTEAASYGPTCLGRYERFECLRNMSECFLQVERGIKAEEVARQLLKEFPRVPLAMIALGEAMSHPSCGKLSPDQLREVSKLADDALKMEKKSDGKEWWRTLEPTNRSNSTVLRTLKLKGLVEGRTKEQNPAVRVANTALDEYFTVGGSIEKAAFAIELALKPELNHPSPLPLHGIRGFIYYSWASEILRANSLCRVDRDRKEGLLRVMAPLKNKLSYKEAHEKVQIAFTEFEYYNKMNVNGEFPKLMYGFNISKTNFALGKFQDGKHRALASIRERAEADLVRLDDSSGTRRKSASEAAQDDHFEGGSTQKLILQLDWALDMNRMLVTQTVLDNAINATGNTATLSSPLLDPPHQILSLEDDAIEQLPPLSIILEQAISLKMIDKASELKLIETISGKPIKILAAIQGLLSAMNAIEKGQKAMNELRIEVGKVIMKFVAGAHRKQKQTKSSSRVVGSLLMEALEWDRNVKIPKDLPKVYLKMAQEFSHGPLDHAKK